MSKRKSTRIGLIEKDIGEMQAAGKSHKEIEQHFGLDGDRPLHRHKLTSFDFAKQLINEYIDFYSNERIQTKTSLTPLEKRRQAA